jgi:hypothetical protein
MGEHYQGIVNVTTTDGQHTRRASINPARSAQPRAARPLEAKFKDCAAIALRPDTVPRLFEQLRNFESISNVRELTDFMEIICD